MGNPNPDMSGLNPFKPGQSGNPNGRPTGRSFKKILDDLLDLEATEKDLDDEEIKKVFKDANHKITNREIMLARMVLRAKQDPDSKAAERLMNRVEGKPVETVHNKLELGTENKITVSKDGDSISLKVEKQVGEGVKKLNEQIEIDPSIQQEKNPPTNE